MSIYYQDETVTLYHGDCLDVLASMPDNSVDSIVTDPPYGLSNTSPDRVAETITRWVSGDREYLPTGRGFMGKEWDAFVPPVAVWDECLRALKPGGHLAAFAGSRTHDLVALSIRLAGFEIRDSLAWLYGEGFPKSLDVSKAIDRAAGAEREVVGQTTRPDGRPRNLVSRNLGVHEGGQRFNGVGLGITAPATPEAARWEGWGTALKPAIEPIVLARKPLEGTVAANVLAHGVGGINIDGCRIGVSDEDRAVVNNRSGAGDGSKDNIYQTAVGYRAPGEKFTAAPSGRWPANVLLDQHAAAWVDEQSGDRPGFATQRHLSPAKPGMFGVGRGSDIAPGSAGFNDHGGASRFFPAFKYQAKAPKRERPVIEREDGTKIQHLTVKPLALMRWLIRLVTPPGGTVLDPFAGSGTTLEAAMVEGFHPVGIEMESDYLPLITARIERAKTSVQEILAQGVFDFEGTA